MFANMPNYTPLLQGDKIRIVFLFQVPSFWPSWESFYYACLCDKRFDVKLVWLNHLAFSQAQMAGASAFLDERQIDYILFDDYDFEKEKPHVAAMQSPYDMTHRIGSSLSWKFRQLGCRVVYIPYGIEITDGNIDRINHFHSFVPLNAWRIFVISELMSDLYKECSPNRAAVRTTGHPKFDAYVNGSVAPLQINIERKIGARKVVLWKMHFPKSDVNGRLMTPDVDEYLEFAKTLSQYESLFFIFMPHPLMLAKSNELSEDKLKLSADIISTVSENENTYVYLDSDYRPALVRADAIITDRSALMIEAGVTGKPVLYMHSADNPEIVTGALAPLVETYYHGTTCDNLSGFLHQIIIGSDKHCDIRAKAFHKTVPFTDGKCGVRISNCIAEDILTEASPRPFRIAAFCMGGIFNNYLSNYHTDAIEIVAISDNNSALWGTKIGEVSVVKPIALRNYEFDAVVIFSERYFREVFRQLVYDVNIDMDLILRVDKFITQLVSERASN